MGKLRKAVFFDRDGTLMEDVHYCNDPNAVRVFAGVSSVLRSLRISGWLVVLVTNQSGIARGRITMEQYQSVHAEFLEQIDHQMDAAYFCADSPDAPTRRRKPGPGMLEEAARDLGIDLGASWMVGDKAVDIEAGRAAGCRTILVRTGCGSVESANGANVVISDVVAAGEWILNAGE
ncbi:MAG: HAD family hydrolase [Terrimicrobiaceae bacterium]|nr:HAD family hydrolase [Terrimicrobiaceae bacterium]